MKLREIQTILNAQVCAGQDQLDKNIVAGAAADLVGDVMQAVTNDSILLTGLTTDEVMHTAKVTDIGAIVVVRGKKPSQELLDGAKLYEIPVLTTEYTLFVACGRLYMNGLRGLHGSW